MNEYVRSSVRKLNAYVPGEQPKLSNIIKLNTNENPYPPSPSIDAVLKSINPADLRLYPDPSCSELRAELARLNNCDRRMVFVANGSDEALRLCIDTFVENDGSVGFFDPSYSLYPVLAATRGFKCKPIDIWPELTWKMPRGYSASIFMVANPNAPTALPFDKAKIREFCKNFRGVVVIDEAYADFADENCMDLATSLPNVLVCRTFSKSYSLAGLRVGYLVGNADLISAITKIKDSYNVDRIAQAIALAAIKDQQWMKGNVWKIRASRERLTNELRDKGWNVTDSQSNFLWCKPPEGHTAAEIFEILRSHSIIVRHWNDERIQDYIRITIGTDDEIDKLLQVLDFELQTGN